MPTSSASRPTSTSTSARTTDVRRRTVLPTTLQNMRQASLLASGGSTSTNELTSDEYLDKIEEELNRKVDADVDVLVEGMAELVKISQIEGKDHFRVSQEAFAAECRTETMIRAAQSLLSLSHTLKLMHLFADTTTPALARERRAEELEKAIAEARGRVEAMADA